MPDALLDEGPKLQPKTDQLMTNKNYGIKKASTMLITKVEPKSKRISASVFVPGEEEKKQ